MGTTALISTVIPTTELVGVAGGVIGVEVQTPHFDMNDKEEKQKKRSRKREAEREKRIRGDERKRQDKR